VRTYSVAKMAATLKDAMRTAERGLKVIIADGECMLVRQRRIRVEDAEKLKHGERVVKTRYGVDDEICTGDHSCIRLSGCPSLTVKPNPDPLRSDPVAAVIESCVGCGLCGEVAHAAVLCPSFYRADVVSNPNWWDRTLRRVRRSVIGWLGGTSPPQRGGGEVMAFGPLGEYPIPSSQPSPSRGEGVRPGESQGNTSDVRPLTILIAALGGEGGGVLTDWIVAAAASQHFPVQSTSIPGVAQRTGATTYHIEMVPTPMLSSDRRVSDPRRPVLALAPGIGDVDLVVASELMEAGRAIAGGFVTPDRTTTIASTSRSYLVVEKMAMGDGRYDQQRLLQAVENNSQKTLLLDLEAIAQGSGAMINAVMLGAIAGAGALPIPAEAFEAAIRTDGKAVDANLRGFRAGYHTALSGSRLRSDPLKRHRAGSASLADLESEVARMPEAARAFMSEGVRRLAAYQDLAYARLYLDRLKPIVDADAKAAADGRLLAETARHLAVRMSYEDVIRVAHVKIDPSRFARITNEMGVKPEQTFTVTEFLKPGVEEFCSILPPWLARRILALAERYPGLGRAHWGMAVNTASVFGYLRFYILARLRGYRPKTFRYQEEQRAIETWLRLIAAAAQLSDELAVEIAKCARLIKGYGDTHKRGSANYRLIETEVMLPALANSIPPRQAAEAIANARTAALLDPEGDALTKCLSEIELQANRRIAAE
jgi:indolepyruvate ferredoxin oxidoreductase beta subunit